MLKFGNKEFRNLQEQVKKNMDDILFILQEEGVLNEFGIKVVGQEATAASMPTVADYKENNPDWSYGDAYAIGTEDPYTLYILTRANGTHPNDYWFNIGQFPVAGPQGPTGPEGPQGPQGQTGPTGADGTSAGFGTISASTTTLQPGEDATVSVSTSGTNAAMNIAFSFGIPEGQPGETPEVEWGDIGGDLSDQTDLVTALQGKQNTLVSGTNIKTINNESILGSGNITIQSGGVTDVEVDGTSVVTAGVAEIDLTDYAKSSDLATVATTGDYDDLIDKPTIPDISNLVTLDTAQTIYSSKTFSNPVEFNSSAVKFGGGTNVTIAGKIYSGESSSYGLVLPNTTTYTANKTVATTDAIPSVSGTNDGTNWTSITINSDTYAIPQGGGTGTITDVEVNGVSVVTAGVAEVTVPTDTSDLTNNAGFITSSALSGYATETWVGNQGYLTSVSWSDVSDKPTFATVATSGDYDDLLNKPTIPAAQVNSDWNAVSGVAQILNKPTLATVATTGAYSDLSGTPDLSVYALSSSLATVATSGSYNDLSNKPTIPTNNNQLINGAGYITGITSSDVVTALGYTPGTSNFSGSYNDLTNKPTILGTSTETWTFTLSDNTTITRTIVLA